MTKEKFIQTITKWYSYNKESFHFPWRNTRDPYQIFVSEIMLQQTQIVRVIPKYEEWLKEFPTLESLAKAPFPKILKVWQGMGYNRRARYLKDTAEIVVRKYNGQIPRDPQTLERFPGIGHYTARAITCFAYGRCEPFLETNIRRGLIHFFGNSPHLSVIAHPVRIRNSNGVSKAKQSRHVGIAASRQVGTRNDMRQEKISDGILLAILSRLEPKTKKREWYYALMDYGREVLGKMSDNPNRRAKHYRTQSKFLGSRRYVRAKIVLYLVSKRNGVNRKELLHLLKKDLHTKDFLTPHVFDWVLNDLSRDKLITRKANKWIILS
ncbi:MAG: A/G-specific adenine glycosylase [Parcubacteria group bacterium Gr01-1014_33]|nr:MAG: A/G-specific adenine glycosylase [Parcubacteria group bacterium Gr01-1014_33]